MTRCAQSSMFCWRAALLTQKKTLLGALETNMTRVGGADFFAHKTWKKQEKTGIAQFPMNFLLAREYVTMATIFVFTRTRQASVKFGANPSLTQGTSFPDFQKTILTISRSHNGFFLTSHTKYD